VSDQWKISAHDVIDEALQANADRLDPDVDADGILTDLAAAGFVVIRPTDPEVIERVAEVIYEETYPEDERAAGVFGGERFGDCERIAELVFAALGGDQ